MQKSSLQVKIKNENKNAFQIVYFIICIPLTVLNFFEKNILRLATSLSVI